MKELTFESTFEKFGSDLYGIILKTEKDEFVQVRVTKEWLGYFELWITRKGVVDVPMPIGWDLARAFKDLGMTVERGELRYADNHGVHTVAGFLNVRNAEGQRATIAGRASEIVMICMQSSKPIFGDENLVWLGSPASFFDEVTPSDFARAYQERFMGGA